jgi:hypothetical protein
MKRIFSNPISALVIGAGLRLIFLLKFPAGSGDTAIYEQLATNWLNHGKYAMDIGGQPVAVDLRMPGYPAFLAMVYRLTGHTGVSARPFVMVAQVLVDLATCVLIAALAVVLGMLCQERVKPGRAFLAGLWLAALCPFTANYVAVPLTEVWAMFFTAAALVILVLVLAQESGSGPWFAALGAKENVGLSYLTLAALAGVVVGLGTLFRPEAPLLLLTTLIVLAYLLFRRSDAKRWFRTVALMAIACALPLLPWTIRNAITFQEFQPLAPKNTMLPAEVDPLGFMEWEGTWLYRFRDCYLVPWKLNEEAINLEDIPVGAFDTPAEKQRVAAVLEQYNDELTWTREEDAVFAQLAKERSARHPLRTHLWIPLQRAVRIWFTPRIELLPVSGNVFPLAYMSEEDPVDQRVTIFYFLLNVAYIALGLWGAWKLWKCRGARAAVAMMLLYMLVRTMFLTTLETPEPRYVLVCFPGLIAMGAQVFGGRVAPASR